MASAAFGTVLRHFLLRLGTRSSADSTDTGLLARFAVDRDEAAFAELVQRHGPMVLGVCRRILRDLHDADDVLQATFLVLARKAGALDAQRPLGSWLYTVARNLALEHRASTARRQVREKEAAAMLRTEPPNDLAWREVCEVLDVELARLPEKYRAPLVLCHLQGMTHGSAARELGWPAGSMAKRLQRGQELLRERLTRRGVTLSATALATLIGQNAPAALPPTLVGQISRAAALYAAGQVTAGLVSAQATALAGGALQALAASRWKLAAAVLLATGLAGIGAAVFGHRSPSPETVAAVPERTAQKPGDLDALDPGLRKKLFTVVAFDRGLDRGTPLKDVVDFFGDRYDVPIRLDAEAFAAAGVDNIYECQVTLPRLRLPLATILRLLLRQIEPLDGRVSGYRIENGTLVIAPVLLENRREEQIPPELPPLLFKRVQCDREPYGMSLSEALGVYSQAFGQKLILDRRSFTAVGERDTDKFPLAGRGRDLPAEPCLMDVLELILWQVNGDTWKSYVRVRAGVIEITAAEIGSEPAASLARHREELEEYWSIWKGKLRQDAHLREPILLPKPVDAAPLEDILEFLADRHDMILMVDSRAFEAASIDKVGERNVRLPLQKKAVPVEELVRLFVQPLRGEEYTADCVCRDGYFEVVPLHQRLKDGQALDARHLESLWCDLGTFDAARARLAAQTLVQAPRETLVYLRQYLQPAPFPEPDLSGRARKLLADLESDQFAARQKATEELEKLGEDALPVLRQRLTQKPSLEVSLRVELLVKKLSCPTAKPELVRALRCVRVLEAIGTPEARRLLETMARGEPSALPTLGAKAALERLNR
jgi:RNA polymerase sigma factor (sigma-70 family)